jgi:hypothetical protein
VRRGIVREATPLELVETIAGVGELIDGAVASIFLFNILVGTELWLIRD